MQKSIKQYKNIETQFNVSNIKKLLPSYLDDAQTNLLIRYLAGISKWNKIYNLTAIKDPSEMVIKHVLDSLAVVQYIHGERIIDVGSGAGLPGMIIAIMYPHKQITLLDSNSKKTRFLKQMTIELKLANVSVINARVETVSIDSCFDCIITRAFASIQDMLIKTQHLMCPQGEFLAMKGLDPIGELKEIPEDIFVKWTKVLKVPKLDAARHLVCLAFKEHE
jgi:16S rRNA (guanine527-N7)-methyltransferase